ncbi:D-amino-acid dehydrogenase [Marivita lacus]|uniref:D-amino-acid dehydrogenase n=1 Tax=Marivita lacus TaxID=1323742 RepID=A0ABQ1LIF3_9RHOB|nr:FAD-binding oxidoreductase [Marivita lacus]GGC23627.1 D-amino-acid dehydrogenase [Marivita lacus]
MTLSDTPRTALVIGAGVIGTASALRLAQAGLQTTLIDWQEPGQGASAGNAGSISSESIVPIALPGMLSQVPKWLFDPQGPLHVRWRYLPRAAPWLIRWVRASRQETVDRSAIALRGFLHSAVDDYCDLLGPEDSARLIRRRGQLIVWRSPRQSRSERVGHALREKHSVAMRWVTPAEITELEPAMAPNYARGLLLERHGHMIDPVATVQALAAKFEALGGVIRKGRVAELTRNVSGDASVLLEGGEILRADRIVLSAGGWSMRLAARLGLNVPLETERGYHVTLPGVENMCSRPIMNADQAFIVTQMAMGLRAAGTVEIAGLDAAPNYARAETLLKHLKTMFPDLPDATPEYWMGCRPSVPDSLPVIDRIASAPNVIVAFGHGHLGMTSAPATARIVRDLALGVRMNDDITPFRATRF